MKTYNAALQAQLDAYLSEQSGLPQSKAAAMIGVSPTALSQYRNSKYPGDVEAVESKIEEFLRTRSAAAQAEAEKAPYLSAGYVPTSVSEDVYKAIQYCQLERGIVVLHGDAGIGKTRGAARFVQDNPANAIYIRCTPVGGTLTAMLRQLGTALKLPATRNRLELSMAIHDRLKGTDKVIIIDEAQNLRFDALEELRSLSDPDDLTGESGTGICLIGNSEVYSRIPTTAIFWTSSTTCRTPMITNRSGGILPWRCFTKTGGTSPRKTGRKLPSGWRSLSPAAKRRASPEPNGKSTGSRMQS